MSQHKTTTTKLTKSNKPDRRKSKRLSSTSSHKRENVTERELDEAIKMTFPASDPISVIQPAPDNDPAQETVSLDEKK